MYVYINIYSERERGREYPWTSHSQFEYQQVHINLIIKSGLLVAHVFMTIERQHSY